MSLSLQDTEIKDTENNRLGKAAGKKSKFFYYWLPVYIYSVLIFISSSITVPPTAGPPVSDWVVHSTIYAAFGLLLFRAFIVSHNPRLKNSFYRSAVLAVSIAIIYGITDEIHQYFVPGRMMSLFDVFANSVGSIIAVSFVLVIITRPKLLLNVRSYLFS